jgi:hypothetical protein
LEQRERVRAERERWSRERELEQRERVRAERERESRSRERESLVNFSWIFHIRERNSIKLPPNVIKAVKMRGQGCRRDRGSCACPWTRRLLRTLTIHWHNLTIFGSSQISCFSIILINHLPNHI